MIGACLREAGVDVGSRLERKFFEWAMDPTSPKPPRKLYEKVVQQLKDSGIYESTKALNIRLKAQFKARFPRPLDLKVIAGDCQRMSDMAKKA